MKNPQLSHRQRAPLSLAIAALLAFPVVTVAADTAGDEERVQVVGSRVAVRSENESAVPVDLISGDDLRKAGATDVGNALELIAPSFNFVEMSVADGSDHVKPAMLRGLGPDQTLVLVNGKRRHQSALIHIYSVGRGTAGTDLNAIPMSAVERIEVLRDGASAQYGSDAIAGVINVVLKKNLGTSISQTFSQTSEGDGDTSLTSVNTGFGVGEGGLNLTAEYKDAERFNRAEPDPYGGEWRFGEPDFKQKSGYFNFELPVGASQLYAFGGVSNRKGDAGGYFRYPDGSSAPDWFSFVPAEQMAIYPNGFLPIISSEVEDKSLAAGVRFDIGDWAADVSLVDGENSFSFDVNHSINFSYGLGPTGVAADVPTSAHAGDLVFGQTTFNVDVSGDVTVGEKSLKLAFGVEARKERSEIKAGDEYSYADYSGEAWGLPQRAGIQVFPGWSPDQENDLTRKSRAFYAEASTDMTESFRLEAAVRFENYEDFGSDTSSKLAGYWELSDKFSLRGSVGDGFRAPSLQQIGYSQLSSQFEASQNVLLGIYANDSQLARDFGMPELKAEDSKDYTLGLVGEFSTGLEFTLDVYQIDIKDRIAVSGQFRPFYHPTIASLMPANVDGVSFFTNAIDTRTQGVDLVVNYRQLLGTGRIDYTFASSYVNTEVTSVDDIPGVLAQYSDVIIDANPDPGPDNELLIPLNEIYFDRHERARIEDYSPHHRHTISARHVTDTWSFGAAANYFGSVKTVYDPNTTDYDYKDDGEWIFDMNLSYDFGNGLMIRGVVNNLADKYPKKQHQDWNGDALPYSLETSQWGYAGRTYSLVGSYTF